MSSIFFISDSSQLEGVCECVCEESKAGCVEKTKLHNLRDLPQ